MLIYEFLFLLSPYRTSRTAAISRTPTDTQTTTGTTNAGREAVEEAGGGGYSTLSNRK